MGWQQQQLRFGVGGLDLRRSRDIVDVLNATQLTNAIRTPDGALTSRLGQTALTTGGTKYHSVKRLDDPLLSTSTRIWGVDTSVYSAFSGALGAAVSTGYSGNPLSLTPWQTVLTGDSWMLVADTNKMVKIRASDNLVLPIGVSVPSAAPTTALGTEHKKVIDNISAAAGFAPHNVGSTNPALTDVIIATPFAATVVNMASNATLATGAYANYMDKALNLDLSTFGGGVNITDDDYIHLWLRADQPLGFTEIRVYLTTGAFTAGTVPGTDTTAAPVNSSGYMKTFRAADIAAMVQTTAPATAVVSQVVGNTQLGDAVGRNRVPPTQDGDSTTTPRTSTNDPTDPSQSPSAPNRAGAWAWTEYGSLGIPLRRGDFQAFGSSPDWSAVKGLTVYASFPLSVIGPINIQAGLLYVTGGSGPDTGEPGEQKYDYVVTNYDPRTGGESNQSATMVTTSWIDALRRDIAVTPPAGTDAAWRQRIYRRGGTITDGWHFVGVNTSNGGVFTDTLNDTQILDADTPPTDNFAAIPTVDASGATVLAQAVPYLWGPIQGIVFAAGDPYRPGSVYYCKPDNVDAWGANDYANVCSPSEKVLGGFVLGSQAYAWSTQGLYGLIVNLNDSGSVSSIQTPCTRGVAAPWAFTVGGGVCWFAAYDGIYATEGGAEVSITEDWVRPLFRGQTVNGYAPVDFTITTALRLAVYQNELWFQYQDINGNRNVLCYHLTDKVWRHASFSGVPNVLYADTVPGSNTLIMGSVASGKSYTYSGVSDDGVAISVACTTGDLNQGRFKSDKLYSDFTIDCDRQGVSIAVVPYTNSQQSSSAALNITSGTGRQPYIYSFTPAPVRGPNTTLAFTWSSATAAPIIYNGTITYEIEPPTITSWHSLPEDHGIAGWHLVTQALVTLRSSAAVTLNVQTISQTGTATTDSYTIPTTGFAKQKLWVPFKARKGVLYYYQLASTLPFIIYWDESYVTVQPWGGNKAATAKVFTMAMDPSERDEALTPLAAARAGN